MFSLKPGTYRYCFVAVIIIIVAASESWAMSVSVEQPTILVTGSNRGLGLEFVRQYARNNWFVIATARRPEQAYELKRLARVHDTIAIELLDVANAAQVAALAAKYRGHPIDVLINNAGVSGDFLGTGQRFGTLDYTTVDAFMNVNAIGPLRVTEAFYDNIKASQQKKVIAITALLGVHSFEYGGFEGAYWYKVSKAAMNAAMYNVALEAKKDKIIVALLTPGEVAVEKVLEPEPHFITPEVSIRGMIKVIDRLTLADSGSIFRYNGKQYDF